MKLTVLLSAGTLILSALFVAVPALAATTQLIAGKSVASTFGTTEIERRKPRVPGGSGCDRPRDVIQHPECTI